MVQLPQLLKSFESHFSIADLYCVRVYQESSPDGQLFRFSRPDPPDLSFTAHCPDDFFYCVLRIIMSLQKYRALVCPCGGHLNNLIINLMRWLECRGQAEQEGLPRNFRLRNPRLLCLSVYIYLSVSFPLTTFSCVSGRSPSLVSWFLPLILRHRKWGEKKVWGFTGWSCYGNKSEQQAHFYLIYFIICLFFVAGDSLCATLGTR